MKSLTGVLMPVVIYLLSTDYVHSDGIILSGSTDYAVMGKPFTFNITFDSSDSTGGIVLQRKLSTDNRFGTYYTLSITADSCKIGGQGEIKTCTHETCTCSDDRKSFTIILESVPSNWHRSQWRCSDVFGISSSPAIELFVVVPFNKVQITPTDVLQTNINSPAKATCTTSPASRPAADITWTLKHTDGTIMDITAKSTQVTNPDNNDVNTVKVTTGTLSFTPTRKQDNGAVIYCQAKSNKTRTITSEEITLDVRYAPSENLIISSNVTGHIKEWSPVALTCRLPGGNPIATLTWSCKGQTITSINVSTSDEAVQKFELTPDRAYNGKYCICTAEHPLLNSKISTEKLFSIYYYVHSDGIILRGSTDYAVMGKPFTFNITFDSLDNTGGIVLQRKLSTDNIFGTYYILSITADTCKIGGQGEIKACAPETCTCSDDRKSFTIIFESVPSNWHRSQWRCSDGFGISTSSAIELFVVVPFNKVQITPTDVLQTNINSPAKATCTTSPASRPAADITWTLKHTDGTIMDITAKSTQVTNPDNNDVNTVKVTTGTLSFTPTRKQDNGAVIYCQAKSNKTRTSTSEEITLDVRYAPSENLIISSNVTGHIKEWSPVTLTCRLPGGNPIATLTWSCKGQTITSINVSTSDEAVQKFELTPDRTYNEKYCICTAEHPLLNSKISTETFFSIYYPPVGNVSSIQMKPQKEFFVEGENVTMTCQSPSASNPVATITWSCKRQDMTSYAQASNIGSVARSNLSITTDKEFNGLPCVCSIVYKQDEYLKRVMTTITVHYGPSSKVSFIPDKDSYVKSRNEPLPNITCEVDCLPKCHIYWEKIGLASLSNPLVLGNIDEEMAGYYVCRASNNRGTAARLLIIKLKGTDIEEDTICTEKPNVASIVLIVVAIIAILASSVCLGLGIIKERRLQNRKKADSIPMDLTRGSAVLSSKQVADHQSVQEYEEVPDVQAVKNKDSFSPGTSNYNTLYTVDEPNVYQELNATPQM